MFHEFCLDETFGLRNGGKFGVRAKVSAVSSRVNTAHGVAAISAVGGAGGFRLSVIGHPVQPRIAQGQVLRKAQCEAQMAKAFGTRKLGAECREKRGLNCKCVRWSQTTG